MSDIRAECERLQALGVAFTKEPSAQGPVITTVFSDTCGNLDRDLPVVLNGQYSNGQCNQRVQVRGANRGDRRSRWATASPTDEDITVQPPRARSRGSFEADIDASAAMPASQSISRQSSAA